MPPEDEAAHRGGTQGESMTQKAYVVSVQQKRIFASCLETEDCASCHASCGKKGSCFEVANPKSMKVSENSRVLISAGRMAQAVQGIVCLLFPVAMAFVGYFACPLMASVFGKTISSDGRAGGVLLFFFAACALVFFLTRKFPIPGKPEIVEVL